MNAKMYIPCSITLTETEYLIVQQLAHSLAPVDYAFSAAIRQIIREWKERRQVVDPQPDEISGQQSISGSPSQAES